MTFSFPDHRLCLATASAPDLGLLMAKRPELVPGDNPKDPPTLFFFDLTHERAFAVEKVLADEEGRFRIKTDRGVEVELRPLSLALYREKVVPKLNSKPVIHSEEDLRQYFLEEVYDSATSPA